MKTRYVVGFMFSPDKQEVVLIRKNRPMWQAGKLNGVGGKMEPNEFSNGAMSREFREETGIFTLGKDWQKYAIIGNERDYEVHLFRMISDKYETARTMTDEQVLIMNVNNLVNEECVSNLQWMIYLALDTEYKMARIDY